MPRDLSWMTEPQRTAVTRSQGTVCVVAGAGAGKTSVIAERFLHLVAEEGVRPSEILTITFTRKAAQEMKQRIIGGLAGAGLHDRRREVENAYIHTIHGFCERLLRENPFDAAVDPSFPVLGDGDARRLLERAFESAVGAALHEEGPLRDLVSAGSTISLWVSERDDLLAALRAAAHSFLEQIRCFGMTREELGVWVGEAEESTEDAPRAAALALAQWHRANLGRLLRGLTDPACRDARRRLGEIPVDGGWWEAARPYIEGLQRLVAAGVSDPRARRLIPEIRNAAREALRAFDAIDPALETAAARRCSGFLKLALLTWRHYEGLKRTDGSLDFNDLEMEAVRLLEECEPVRNRYQSKFRHILVDEFQDVNPLQARLVRRLSSGDNVCFVGDPRQAIYGFRHCDRQQFRNWEEEVRRAEERDGAAAAHVPLDTNFRSREGLLAFIAELMDENRRGEFGRLVGAREDVSGPHAEVWLCDFTSPEDEAKRLVQGIVTLLRDPEVKVEDGGELRRARLGDVALLFRQTSRIEMYQDVLYRAGVPNHLIRTGRNYFARYEVRDLRNALQALARPFDDLALACVLRSPLVGLSMDAMTLLAAEGERGPLAERVRADLDLPPEDADKLARFREWFGRLSRHVDRREVGEVMEEVLRETDYAAKLLCRDEGVRQLANVRKLLQIALEARGATIEQFVRRLDRLERIQQREGDAPTHDERSDTVKLLTVHGAKGLEFPIVVLPHLYFWLPPVNDLFLASPADRRIGTKLDGERSLMYETLLKAKKARDEGEELRLLYVAMTRARDYLVLSVPKEGRFGDGNWVAAVRQALGFHSPRVPAGVRRMREGAQYRVRDLTEEEDG